jgi:hypothetical protein
MTAFISEDVWEADLAIDRLTISADLQVRELQKDSTGLLIRNDIVEDYRELLAEDVELGSLEVIEEVDAEGQVTGRLLLADGFHRVEAHRRLRRETVHCRVRRGTVFTALLLAAQSNGGRGLQYTLADRCKVAERLLEALAEQNLTWSDTQIAQLARIHRTTVAKIRASLTAQRPLPATRQVVRNGAVYPMTPARPASYRYDALLDSMPFAEGVVEPPIPGKPLKKPARPRPHPGNQRPGSAATYHPPSWPIPFEERRATPTTANTVSIEPHQVDDMLAGLHSDASAEGVHFIIGWRLFRAGAPHAQGVANHTLPASQLPADVRTALLYWLQSNE